jgi:hypothetical protein
MVISFTRKEEEDMKTVVTRMRLLGWLVLVIVAACSAPAAKEPAEASPGHRVETITLTGTRGAVDISTSVADVGDVPHHEVAQRVYSYTVSSADAADFDGATTTNFAQGDSINGAGTHHGYAVWKLKSGDTVTIRFDGRHQALAHDGAEAPYEGELHFTGGTGKYRHIQGHAKYRGHTSAAGGSWTTTVTIEY